MKALLISGGKKVKKTTLLENVEDRYIIVADGGVKNLIGTEIIPDEVLGDFDSIDEKGREFLFKNKVKVKKYPAKKDLTDTELCLEVLIEKGATDITILAASGTRLDHTVSSLFLLERLKREKIRGRFVDDNNFITFVEDETVEVVKNKYKYLSVVPVSKEFSLTTEGTEYNVKDLKYNRWTIRGTSNEIVEEVSKITAKGSAFLILSRD